MVDDTLAPKLFISYSHENEHHSDWILQLATRLRANGVNVILDRWDLRLGANVQAFMESASVGSSRVLSVCTDQYVKKANDHKGGVGYEKTILNASIMKDQESDRIIPLIRDNDSEAVVPFFLSGRMYIDFRDDLLYEARYNELIREIYGQHLIPKPPLGENPFTVKPQNILPVLAQHASRYVSPALYGRVSFNYSNNNGSYILGAGDMAFETCWSTAGHGSIYAYNDAPSIRSVALVEGISDVHAIVGADQYDASSRTRTARVGDSVVWQNVSGYYAATSIESVTNRDSPNGEHQLVFRYAIQPSKSPDFSTLKDR